ncbi:hypothetical protein MNEG_16572 [Monoraphidium neglectum]|uniref:Peptidase M16 C-terminal domain-containing protein n=1 Tax=Monoraphidium neglectum TaxID=145388 RepID=A0A0D2ITP1_9CHLO|nr:hypothetical protein MNEG_16572 [Monoraphidium neglectum]KIY91392.1 hypothetical protein MNEG_16572 [Monoraphidium neglectum]|eukprot:XP_013890412.1 hypothetical protein MNEG_16572 [Monoraphidium neglectum]
MRAALPSLLPHTPVLIAPRSAAVPPAAKPPGGCYYFEPLTLEDVEKVDPHQAVAMHTGMFSNPAEFTVVLTGNLSCAQALPLIEMYLASIPARQPPDVAGSAAALKGMLGAPRPPPQPQPQPPADGDGGAADAGSEAGPLPEGARGAAAAEAGSSGRRSEGEEEEDEADAAAAGGAAAAAAEGAVAVAAHCGKDARTVTPLPFEFPERPVREDVAVDMVSPLSQAHITFPCLLQRATAMQVRSR